MIRFLGWVWFVGFITVALNGVTLLVEHFNKHGLSGPWSLLIIFIVISICAAVAGPVLTKDE